MRNLPISYMDEEFARFLTVDIGEEAIDQPIYDIQSYAAAGAVTFNFFNHTVAGATNGLGDTNLTTANQLGAGNRYLCRSISVFFMSSVVPQQYAAGAGPNSDIKSYINDAVIVLESAAYLQFNLGVKPYIQTAPITYYPAGFGVYSSHGGIQSLQAAAADAASTTGHATNGFPVKSALHQLAVPLVIPPLFQFSATITYPAAKAISAAGRIGVALNGLLIRPVQ